MKLHAYITPQTYKRGPRLCLPTKDLIDQVTPLAQVILGGYRGTGRLIPVAVVYALACAQETSNRKFMQVVHPKSLARFMEGEVQATAIPRAELEELVDTVLEDESPESENYFSVLATYAIVEAYLNRKVTV